MKVLTVFPPRYKDINAAFDVRGKPILFTVGDTIYNPSRVKIPPQLMVHEAVHCHRQGDDPAGWWDRYLVNADFRLEEELPAHRAEYADICKRIPDGGPRERMLDKIAERLASPLYGRMIDFPEARLLICNPALSI